MPYLGELLSLSCAAVWAAAVIFLRRSGESASPFALNLFRVGLSSILLIATLLVIGEPLVTSRPLSDYLWLTASGVVGIALSDTLFHRCLNLVGAGINGIVSCLYPPFVVLFAVLLLGEKVGVWELAGMALVITGVVVTTNAVPPPGAERRDLLVGLAWGVGAMATLALGIVWAKPVLEGGSVLWATTVRQLVSFAVMAPVALVHPRRRQIWGVFRPRAEWRFTVPGAALGSYLALMMWLGGMKYAPASVAAVLNQTSVVLTLIFASLFLAEPFTARRWAAAGLALAGTLMVVFN